MAIHAHLIGDLDRLSAIDTKLNQPANADASSGDRMVAAGAVASFASTPFEVVARFDLEQPPHFGFGEFAREIQMAGVAIHAADIFRLREVANVAVDVGQIRKHAGGAHEATRNRHRDHAIFCKHATSLWQHRGRLARPHACLTVRVGTEMLSASRGEVREFGLTGLTRNQVSPCGSGGSNPSLSANQSFSILRSAHG